MTAPNPIFVLNADDTTLQAAQRNILANSTEMVRRLNADLLSRYQSAYQDYLANMHSGENVPADRIHAPLPPYAWELAPPDGDGFIFYQVSKTTRIADPASYPDTYNSGSNPQPNATPNMIMVGARTASTNWFTALKGDTFPSGKMTPPVTSSDGVIGIFEKFGAPVGPGWYLLMN